MRKLGSGAFAQVWQCKDLKETNQVAVKVLKSDSMVTDRFTNELFWNFKKCRAVSMEAYPYKQMSEKKFFPNVAPSPGSGPPLIYKAKYKGLISKNQYPAITFDWSVLRT